MPRPCKRRRICSRPPCGRFAPEGADESGMTVVMTLDEYEAIRLIDFVGMTQEQCAAQMNVARATIQAIYGSARAKMARCLVRRCALVIEGGDVEFCAQNEDCAQCEGRSGNQDGRNTIMKIAVTYDNGQIFQHFGHCALFKLYETEDGKIVSSKIIDANGSGHSMLAGMLMMNGADAVICGGIGGGAQTALARFGIKVYGGVTGDADAAVQALLDGTLVYSEAATCGHHDHAHGEGHACGEHGCGEHGEDHECHCH